MLKSRTSFRTEHSECEIFLERRIFERSAFNLSHRNLYRDRTRVERSVIVRLGSVFIVVC